MTRSAPAVFLLSVLGCSGPSGPLDAEAAHTDATSTSDAAGADAMVTPVSLASTPDRSVATRSLAWPPSPPAVVAADAERAVRGADPGPTAMQPFDSVTTVDTLPPAERPARLAGARFSSRPLRAAIGLRPSLRRARRAADGARDGTYRWVAFRLRSNDLGSEGPRSEDLETQLRACADIYLRPDPMDFVYYADAERLAEPAASAFDIGWGFEPAEGAAAGALAGRVAALMASHPRLRIFRLHAGWGDAVGGAYHGLAIVDPETGEALWLFAEETWRV